MLDGEVAKCAPFARREVLLWIARGKSNRDVAEILTLSPRTVNKHLKQIFNKLGVENRTSAAALAARTLGGPLHCVRGSFTLSLRNSTPTRTTRDSHTYAKH
jgi:DNA-binding CsgD family transcriptional regulator